VDKEDDMTKMDPPPRSSSELVSMTQVVAENVRRVRTQKGWSQEELRHRLGAVGRLVSRATVAAFESGDRSIGVSDLLALGLALGVAPHVLLYPQPRTTVLVNPEPNPKYEAYGARVIADWLWDPDGHELSTAGISEWTVWFASADVGDRVAPEDLKELTRKVRRGEDGIGTEGP
jgi:transcriptional regulator with XRE-family HTH domain